MRQRPQDPYYDQDEWEQKEISVRYAWRRYKTTAGQDHTYMSAWFPRLSEYSGVQKVFDHLSLPPTKLPPTISQTQLGRRRLIPF
jgi:hypothetical protein